MLKGILVRVILRPDGPPALVLLFSSFCIYIFFIVSVVYIIFAKGSITSRWTRDFVVLLFILLLLFLMMEMCLDYVICEGKYQEPF